MSKIPEVDGWLEANETATPSMLVNCPKCGRKLNRVDATQVCGIIFVYCMGTVKGKACRFAKEYKE